MCQTACCADKGRFLRFVMISVTVMQYTVIYVCLHTLLHTCAHGLIHVCVLVLTVSLPRKQITSNYNLLFFFFFF